MCTYEEVKAETVRCQAAYTPQEIELNRRLFEACCEQSPKRRAGRRFGGSGLIWNRTSFRRMYRFRCGTCGMLMAERGVGDVFGKIYTAGC